MYDFLIVGLCFITVIVISFIATWAAVLKRPRDAGFHVSSDRNVSEDEIYGDVVIVPQAGEPRP